MLTRLKRFLFGPPQTDPARAILESEVLFLRTQVESLQQALLNLTEKPKLRVSDPQDLRFKVFDPKTKSLVPASDEFVHETNEIIREMGLF